MSGAGFREVEVWVLWNWDSYQVPKGYYFRSAPEFRCLTAVTSGLWKNIRCGAGIIEASIWQSREDVMPTYEIREVYQVWKSANSAENRVEIQMGIHRSYQRDLAGKRSTPDDRISYEVGE